MMRLKLILLLFFLHNVLFAQHMGIPFFETNIEKNTPEHIKRITCYIDKSLLTIREYDQSGKIIFSQNRLISHRKEISLVFVDGYIYDENGFLVKRYSLHSNVGLAFLYFENDSLGRKIKSKYYDYKYDNDEDLINTNPYIFNAEIKTMDALLNYPDLEEMEQKSKHYSTTEYIYDNQGNLIQKINVSETGRQDYQLNKYDENNNKIHYLTWNDDDNDTLEVYYTYRMPLQRTFFYDEDTLQPPPPPLVPLKHHVKKYNCLLANNEFKKPRLLQSIRIDNEPVENKKMITSITHYSYDFQNLIDERNYENGEFKYYVQYKYNCSNQIIQRDWCRVHINNTPVRIQYKYNNRGFVKRLKMIDEKIKTNVNLSYKLEFYDK